MGIEDFIAKFSILGIPLIVLIPILVQGLKAVGVVKEGWGTWWALGVSIISFGLAALGDYFPATLGPISYLLGAVLVWLTGVGGYATISSVYKRSKGIDPSPDIMKDPIPEPNE
jgi:hypothetical protein